MLSDELLTAQELAKYLKLDEMTIYNWASAGVLPSHRLLKHWRFRKQEIDRWLSLVWFPALVPEPRAPRKLTVYDHSANRVVSRAVSDQHLSKQLKALKIYLGETTTLNQHICRSASRGWTMEKIFKAVGIDDTWVRERARELFTEIGILELGSGKGNS